MTARNQPVLDFAARIKALGFRVYVAKLGQGAYGFITDDSGARALSFSFNDGGRLGGNYGPPSTESGTGWRLEETPYDLRTAEDVRRALYAAPHYHVGKGWSRYTTADEYLKFYSSSNYAEADADALEAWGRA